MIRDCDVLHERVRFTDINIATKSGVLIPFHITITPLQTKTGLLRGLLILGEDIRTTKWLEEEIDRHKLTNEKLYNSEQLFRKLLEITPISILLIHRETGKIIYLNSQAVELLGGNSEVLKGKDISLLIKNQRDRKFLIEGVNDSQIVKKNDILIQRPDESEFVGMVTATTCIYHEEEALVACVVDMTEQKRVEDTLTQNNEYINQLNKELMNMNNRLVNKSIRDGLTNLYNHQYMNEILGTKVQEISGTNKKLCLMMCDIDHFKHVNDQYGHQIGDLVLAKVAELITKNTRDSDYIGRYGGEEFIAVLPDTDLDTADNIAQVIRKSIQSADYGFEGLRVTISIGVAQCIDENVNELINKADMLLYKAKANGRNRVEIQ
jgi:diguanylate cyclase (GGDEF)-like protein/PAS domain S-box-containing protein